MNKQFFIFSIIEWQLHNYKNPKRGSSFAFENVGILHHWEKNCKIL